VPPFFCFLGQSSLKPIDFGFKRSKVRAQGDHFELLASLHICGMYAVQILCTNKLWAVLPADKKLFQNVAGVTI